MGSRRWREPPLPCTRQVNMGAGKSFRAGPQDEVTYTDSELCRAAN